jgi:Xaa-Pro dipeptidase
MSRTQSAAVFQTRHSRLFQAMEEKGLDAYVVNAGPSFTYLSGGHFHLSERPVVAIFAPGMTPALVLPEFEVGKTETMPFEVQPFTYGENPLGWQEAFRQAANMARLSSFRVGLEPKRLRVLELRFLEQAAPGAVFIAAEDVMAALRMKKDASEIQAMRKAVEIAEKALLTALKNARMGMTERELAAELTLQLLRHGSDAEMPFSPIVAAGPNAANPHATPSDRQISSGDLLIIDWGANSGGYFSDLTRTFAVGKIDPELERIVEVCINANAAGREAAGPGTAAGAVDRAARDVIEKAGYGRYFTHRTGHGLGMEGHEDPYIFGENSQKLEEGMTFTVEPGIYLPGRGGVRVEDDVVVTATGAESLSTLKRELVTIG